MKKTELMEEVEQLVSKTNPLRIKKNNRLLSFSDGLVGCIAYGLDVIYSDYGKYLAIPILCQRLMNCRWGKMYSALYNICMKRKIPMEFRVFPCDYGFETAYDTLYDAFVVIGDFNGVTVSREDFRAGYEKYCNQRKAKKHE